eukprot:12329152-Heterocapsa_arctica.AAC.1
MTPARGRHLGDGGQAFRRVRELQASGRRQVVRQLASSLRRDVTHGRKLGDVAVSDLRLAAAGKVLGAAICSEASRAPQKPTGACTPSMFTNARSGKAA